MESIHINNRYDRYYSTLGTTDTMGTMESRTYESTDRTQNTHDTGYDEKETEHEKTGVE
jgi:hypothetical protein